MSADPFHLGWFFQASTAQAWGEQFSGSIGRDWMRPDFHADFARALERARFDYLLIEDASYVADMWGGSMQIYLENAMSVPRQDPAVVAGQMLMATSRIGIVPTLATFAYPPYILARLLGTLDQVSGGRVGWNMVTGSSTRAAQNFGLPDQAEHDRRYDMADEYMAVVNALWDSWSPDSIVDDLDARTFADPAKVRTIDVEGEFYTVRGPLNSGPLPQGRPAIAQAGASARGRQFAATHGHTIVCDVEGIEKMKAYRDDVRARMTAMGRNPDDCKVLFMATPVVGATMAEAREKERQLIERNAQRVEITLAGMSKGTNIDFSQFPLDEPLGDRELRTNGHQASLEAFIARSQGKTLRESAMLRPIYGCLPFIGTPDSIAAQMDEAMQEIGGDGFLLHSDILTRRVIAEITDGLVPALQRRGLTRTQYEHTTLTENLLAY